MTQHTKTVQKAHLEPAIYAIIARGGFIDHVIEINYLKVIIIYHYEEKETV
jgi:hypothetical protein